MDNRKIALGALTAGAGVVAGAYGLFRWNFRMPMKDYRKAALYMAVLDDEICRCALEGTEIAGKPVEMMERGESLQYRYHLFLKLNRRKSAAAIAGDISDLERQRQRQLTEN